jgi:hypothetical protein
MPKVVAATTSGDYISTDPEKYKRLPIAVAMGDNSSAWQKFAKDELGLAANVCRSVREDRAAEWFAEWWCGPVKGLWLLGHGGVAMSGNNQGVESNHWWDREAISHGRQVSRPCCQFIIH